MKKITLFFAVLIAAITQSYAQVSGYSFLESTETYTPVTGTSSTASGDDGSQNGIAIGFTFKFEGVDYTHLCINTNGWIKLGNASTTIGTGSFTNLLSNTATHKPLIAPFWDDNNKDTGSIQYALTGTSPNQVLEISWDNINIGGSGATSAANLASFKLRLYETTNVIDFVYGPTMASAGTLSASVGLNGSSSFLSVTPGTTSTVSSATANNTISATTNLVGKKFTFTPPSCIATAALTFANITTSSADVSWTAPVPAPSNGYEYVVDTNAADPLVAGTATSGTSANITGLSAGTMYYVHVRSNCGSGYSAWRTSSFVTVCAATNIPYTQDFETVTVPALPICTTVVNSGTGNVWVTVSNPGSGFTTKALKYGYNSSNAANTWFFTQGINLTAGTSYRISYNYGNNSASFVEKLKVAYGSSADAVSMTNTIADHSNVNQNAIQTNIVDFTPSTSGVYYIGFQAYSASNQYSLFVDNITVDVAPACSSPLGLSATGITQNTANLSWAAFTGAAGYEYVIDNTATDPTGAGTAIATTTYNASGLTANTVYYLHVRTNCGSIFSSWATLMFTTLATPPANDDCAGATVLALGSDYVSAAITSSLVGASNSETADPSIPAPGCALYIGHDVWFTTTVPGSGSITLETGSEASSAVTDTGMAVYTGTCGALVLAKCNDSGSTNTGDHAKITLSASSTPAVSPGQQLFVRVWRYNSNAVTRNINAVGEFKIAAYDVSLSSNSFDFTGFRAYPNPVDDIFNISYNKEISNISVVNLLGQEVMVKKVNALNTTLDMSSLAKGTYLLKVTSDNQVGTIKIVKE